MIQAIEDLLLEMITYASTLDHVETTSSTFESKIWKKLRPTRRDPLRLGNDTGYTDRHASHTSTP
jgi:hypothetical protein